MKSEIIFFVIFLAFILFLLFLDLGMFSKKGHHTVKFKESLIWTSIWVGLSILFFLFIRLWGNLIHGIYDMPALQSIIAHYHDHLNITGLSYPQALKLFNHNLSLQYITGYIIEYSLSMDNVFVILLIFLSFKVPEKYYKQVLFWGILGAIVMRFIFIFLLSAIIYKFDKILIAFGILLLVTGGRMGWDFFKGKERKINVEHHPVVRFVRKFFPLHPSFVEHHFWLKKGRMWYITPLLLVLLVVEFSDVIFAVDSVPAIFAVTRDPYIVFFSNVFAIMGLRSLFFLISHFFNRFYFLRLGLAVLLGFIGVKMILPFIDSSLKIDNELSLLIISGIFAVSVISSLLRKREG